jgi:hypothetical protein
MALNIKKFQMGCYYAEYHNLFIGILNVVMLSVSMLNVVALSVVVMNVVAPKKDAVLLDMMPSFK